MQEHGKANRGNEPWFDTLVELLAPASPARLPHPEAPLEPATWGEHARARLRRLAPHLAAMRPMAERTSRGFEFALSGLVIAYLAMVTVDLTGERSMARRSGESGVERVAVTTSARAPISLDVTREVSRRPFQPELPTLGSLQPLPAPPGVPLAFHPPLSAAARDALLAALEADYRTATIDRPAVPSEDVVARRVAAGLRDAIAHELEHDAAAGRALARAALQERERQTAATLERLSRAVRLAAVEAALEHDRQALATLRRDILADAATRAAGPILGPLEEAAAFAPYTPLPASLTRDPSRTVQVVRLRFTRELLAQEKRQERERAAAAARRERREQAEEAARKRLEARNAAQQQKRNRPKSAPTPAPTPAPSWSTLFPTVQQ